MTNWFDALRKRRDTNNQVGSYDLTDFRGNPIVPGATVLYPSEAYGKSVQLTEAIVISAKDGVLEVQIVRRSRTGAPNLEYRRARARVKIRNLANVAVVT